MNSENPATESAISAPRTGGMVTKNHACESLKRCNAT